jgi:hypothetical protein
VNPPRYAALPAQKSSRGRIENLQSPTVQNVLQLRTRKEKAALAALRPVCGSIEEFHRLVLNLLDIIARPEIYYRSNRQTVTRGLSYRVSAAEIREYRRTAKSAEKMANQLAKDEAKLRAFGFSRFEIPAPPIGELKRYARLLEQHADADQPYVTRPVLRHRRHKSTSDIIALVRLVEQESGKPNWKNLAILIKAALGDTGFNEDRLRKIVKYHEKKSRNG